MNKSTVFTCAFLLLTIVAAASATSLKVGDKAPEFALPNQNGDTVKLSDYFGKKTLVVVFFGATCSDDATNVLKPYLDRSEQFKRANAEIVGITVENVYAVEAFATELQTPFPLLSDYEIHFEKKVSRAYGVIDPGARFAGHYTVVIDRNGIIRAMEKDANPDQVLQSARGL